MTSGSWAKISEGHFVSPAGFFFFIYFFPEFLSLFQRSSERFYDSSVWQNLCLRNRRTHKNFNFTVACKTYQKKSILCLTNKKHMDQVHMDALVFRPHMGEILWRRVYHIIKVTLFALLISSKCPSMYWYFLFRIVDEKKVRFSNGLPFLLKKKTLLNLFSYLSFDFVFVFVCFLLCSFFSLFFVMFQNRIRLFSRLPYQFFIHFFFSFSHSLLSYKAKRSFNKHTL